MDHDAQSEEPPLKRACTPQNRTEDAVIAQLDRFLAAAQEHLSGLHWPETTSRADFTSIVSKTINKLKASLKLEGNGTKETNDGAIETDHVTMCV